MKILILIPTKDSVNPKCLEAIYAQDFSEYSVLVNKKDSNKLKTRLQNIIENRIELREKALKTDAEWFLWLDSDVVLPPNTLSAFLKQSDPLMGAWYQMPNGWSISPEKTFEGAPKDVVSARHIGFGAMMMHRDVLEKIEISSLEEKTEIGNHIKCECRKFCEEAIKLGFTPMAIPIMCQHLKKPPSFRIGFEAIDTIKRLLVASNLPVVEVLKTIDHISALPALEDN